VDKVLSVYLQSGRMPHVTDSQNHCDEGSDGAAMASRDKTGRDCRHIGFPHVHGTRAAYVSDRCGCTLCRAANRAAEQHRTTAKRLSRWEPYVDAEPTRDTCCCCANTDWASTESPNCPAYLEGLFDDC
jgi:hypothetical protein